MRKFILPALMLIFLCFYGCHPMASTKFKYESLESTKITEDSSIASLDVKILKYDVRKNNGLLQVQMTLQNIAPMKSIDNSTRHFQYRFRWMDKDGFALDIVEPIWKSITITSKEEVMINEIATDKKAEKFIFEIRFPLYSNSM